MGFGGNAESHFCASTSYRESDTEQILFVLRYALRTGLRRKESSLSFVYPALSPQRALRTSGTYWANRSSRLAALHSSLLLRCRCVESIKGGPCYVTRIRKDSLEDEPPDKSGTAPMRL